MAVLAHPDDESFAVGGTLAKYAVEGANVDLIVATRGEAGISGKRSWEAAEIRESELWRACLNLGIRRLEFLGFTDGQLAEVPEETAVTRLVEKIRRSHPDVVITFGPEGISGHPDHVAVSRWTTMAFDWLSQEPGGPRRLYYILPSEATQQSCGVPPQAKMADSPLVSIDIGPFRIIKVIATRQHRSQNPPPYYERVEDAAQRLACHELFRLARPVKAGNGAEPEDDLFSDIGD